MTLNKHSNNSNNTQSTAWCCVASLTLHWCEIESFGFVDPSALERLVIFEPMPKLDEIARVSLGHLLVRCSHLHSLALSSIVDSGDDRMWLINALKHLTRLTHLDLQCNYLGERSKLLNDVLACMINLTSLNLAWNGLGVNGMKYVGPSLGNMRELTDLNLAYNSLGEIGADFLAHSLSNMPHLTTLNLHDDEMGVKGVTSVLPAIVQMTHLSSLNLQGNYLDDQIKFDLRKQLSIVCELKL
eukprot:c9762_g2_i1.p1 GENE.c9762_g2_i1~~c9762_g2_i1.p1  ORF type:complete len:242 (-),score=45.57 c9762_g2_i1:12-737(-)